MPEPENEERFRRLVMPHMDAAYNLARWLTGNAHDAEDVTQEAFLRAFRFIDSLRGEDARAWMLKIVRNTFYNEWRRTGRREEATEFDEDLHSLADDDAAALQRAHSDPESIAARADDIRLLDKALEQLPVEFREALVLRELEDLSYKEIAAAMDVPIGTVMSRIARARRLLADIFERLGGSSHGLQRDPDPARRVR